MRGMSNCAVIGVFLLAVGIGGTARATETDHTTCFAFDPVFIQPDLRQPGEVSRLRTQKTGQISAEDLNVKREPVEPVRLDLSALRETISSSEGERDTTP